MHISAGSIPASPVQGRSCSIPTSPTTTGSCALFIAGKLMRICPGTATQGCRPGRPAGRRPARPAAAAAPSSSASATSAAPPRRALHHSGEPSGVDSWSDTEPSPRPLVVLEPQNHLLMLHNTFNMLYTTFAVQHTICSYITCYIYWYILITIHIFYIFMVI